MKPPPPPEVGDKFWGPGANDARKRSTYELRAIVDPVEHPSLGWYYWVVLRFWNPRKKHQYIIESSFALAVSYTPKRKRRPKTTAS